MSKQAFQSYTPRVLPTQYDSLESFVGCEDINGVPAGNVLPFEQYCGTEHDEDSGSIFNELDTVSYTAGPDVEGGDYPFNYEWAFWVNSNEGVRFGMFSFITPPSPTLGDQALFFWDVKAIKVSGAFDSRGNQAVVIQRDSDEFIELKYSDGELELEASWAGYSPVIAWLGMVVGIEEDIPGLFVLYLKSTNPNSLFVRLEEDGFDTEYELHSLLPFRLTRLIRVTSYGTKMLLFARDHRGADVTMTKEYPVRPKLDKETLNLAITEGLYFLAAVESQPDLEDVVMSSVTVDEGLYFLASKEADPQPSLEKATLSVAIIAGEYEASTT